MSETYHLACDCGAVEFECEGPPKVRGFCHCDDCRNFLKVPYHSVDAWESDKVKVTKGSDQIAVFQHPQKKMKRFFCQNCGETVFNSNAMDWRIVSQLLVRRQNQGILPDELASKSHFHYGQRIVDIDDELPKRE
ncbi:Glutathione-dependent formaldehyde-activating enzyme [Microbulbifer aggregans]|uniref:Glutathione-dependent formaldehyde-activating enzyme n=1 Tax=Microbulbifer aggregans TaxID=1769779 RepID=A0A1C9W3K5_9GAMM|nr:GFA family protein [Microbulbifer aggregans]AOS95736.1 Glutathione-dependent formaldehyde-activating enzyme [Microbulbifer aggregans]